MLALLDDDDVNNITSQYRALLRETCTCHFSPHLMSSKVYSPPKKLNIELETKQFSVLLLL